MNIWLPIVVNSVILGILLGGLFIGKKKGFLYEFLKLIFVAGAGVGLYFLNPILVNLVLRIPIIQTLIDGEVITLAILKSLTLVLAFVLADVILTGIFAIVRKIAYGKNHVKANTAKPVKIKGITKAETRSLRKEHKHLVKEQKREERKLAKTQIKKRTKILGASERHRPSSAHGNNRSSDPVYFPDQHEWFRPC